MDKKEDFFDDFDECDAEKRLAVISKLGDPLEKLSNAIDFEAFRPAICAAFEKESLDTGGEVPFDCVSMFKVLVLQRVYNLSDDEMAFRLKDSLSFMRFINVGVKDKKPDAKAILSFKNRLARCGFKKKLFAHFDKCLKESGLDFKIKEN